MFVPSGPIKTDLICFSPTIDDFIIWRSSTTNLGSGFPEPKGDKELIYYENVPYGSYKLKGEFKKESVDKDHFGCFRRKDAVIVKEDGNVIKGSMCNQKWGIPECEDQEPNKIVQSILNQPKIDSLRGYHKNPDLYTFDFIHYLNKEPIPIITTFFS